MPCIKCTHFDQCCAASSLLHAIALEETVISHVLNAEGEKLQKALAISCDTNNLIEINKSVENMVDKITNLELVLKSKLDFIAPILEECDKKPHKNRRLQGMQIMQIMQIMQYASSFNHKCHS